MRVALNGSKKRGAQALTTFEGTEMLNDFRKYIFVTGLATAVLAGSPVWAQPTDSKFPDKPIRLLVGFAPGGGTDISARIIAPKMAELLGQTVVVENRSGANGNIASEALIRSAPDGYTILLASIGALAINPHMPGGTTFNPLKDFSMISLGVTFPNVLVVNSTSSVKSLADYIASGKRGKDFDVFYGSSGSGSTGHLAGELLKMRSGMSAQHVNYKGGGPAMTDLLGNNIQAIFASSPTAVPLVTTGKLRAIAVTSPQRVDSLPDVPTVAEQGFPGYQAMNWYAFVAPAKTPAEVIEKLNRAVVASLKDPSTIERLKNMGIYTDPSTPEEMFNYVQREYETWGKVVSQVKF